MTAKAHPLDPGFVEKQRQALLKLRVVLLNATSDGEADEAAIKEESAGGPREFEDDAQKLATLELDGNLVVRDVARLERPVPAAARENGNLVSRRDPPDPVTPAIDARVTVDFGATKCGKPLRSLGGNPHVEVSVRARRGERLWW